MDPADLAALTSAIETAIANGFTRATSSMSVPDPAPDPGSGSTDPPGTRTVIPSPPPEVSNPTTTNEEAIAASRSMLDQFAGLVSGTASTLTETLDQLVKIQNESGAKLVRDLRRQVGISVREGETISQAINRTTNLGAQAVGRSIEAFEENMMEFMKFEGLDPDTFLRNLNSFINELGDTNINLLQQTDKAMMETMAIFQNSMQMSSEEVAELIAVSYAETGEASSDILEEIANQAKVVGDAVGVPFVQMGEGIREVKADMDVFTDVTVAGAARIVASLSQMGMSITTFKNIMQPFRDFDSAATKMGDLSAMFGVQMDAMEMMYLANEDEEKFLHRMREQLLDQGLDVESMSKTRQRALADTLGMGVKEMKMFMQTGQQVTSMEDLQARSQEAATRSQADAMEALNETMAKVARSSREVAEALQFKAGIRTGGAVREMSAAAGEAVQNLAEAVTQGTEFANMVAEAQQSLAQFTSQAANIILEKGSDLLTGLMGDPGGNALFEFEESMNKFDAEAPARAHNSMMGIGDSFAEGQREAGLESGSWAPIFEILATTLGSDQFDGGAQMSFYLDKIYNFGETLADEVRGAMLMISDAFDFESLSNNFLEAETIVNTGIVDINRAVNSMSDQITSPEITLTPEITDARPIEVVQNGGGEILSAVREIIEKFEKEPTEVKVEFNLDEIKGPLMEAIKEGFDQSNYQINLQIDREKIATVLLDPRTVSVNGQRFQSRGG